MCGDLPDLEAGVYHFGPGDFALRCLRTGDHRRALVQATGGEAAVAAAPLTVSVRDILAKCLEIPGPHLSALLLGHRHDRRQPTGGSAAYRIPAKVVMGFVDATVNHLLGLDVEREVALTLVTLGQETQAQLGVPPPMAPLALETVPLSNTEVDYPTIRAMHAASVLDQEDEARRWHGWTPIPIRREPTGKLFPLQPMSDADIPSETIEQVDPQRRGSSRRFAQYPSASASCRPSCSG